MPEITVDTEEESLDVNSTTEAVDPKPVDELLSEANDAVVAAISDPNVSFESPEGFQSLLKKVQALITRVEKIDLSYDPWVEISNTPADPDEDDPDKFVQVSFQRDESKGERWITLTPSSQAKKANVATLLLDDNGSMEMQDFARPVDDEELGPRPYSLTEHIESVKTPLIQLTPRKGKDATMRAVFLVDKFDSSKAPETHLNIQTNSTESSGVETQETEIMNRAFVQKNVESLLANMEEAIVALEGR
jgi:hypothetical protein